MGGTRQRMREQLRDGKLDDRMVEVDVQEKSFPSIELITGSSMEEVGVNLRDMMPGLFQGRSKRRRVTVAEARERLLSEEEQKLIDMDAVAGAAVERVEQAGIIFVDEIDKIAGREGSHGPEVSREGVQRDILPIVEGTTVNTKHGMVRTDHILFIAAGAFHVSKPSDLIPELQGRFPIRVELEPLGQAEFVRILTEPRSALDQAVHRLDGDRRRRPAIFGRRGGDDCGVCDDRQRAHREHRRAAAAHGDGAAARRGVVRGADPPGEVDHDRRALRAPHAGGHRQERRPVPLHIVTHSTRAAVAAPRRRSLRAAGLVFVPLVVTAGCGKKGPPLVPFSRVPSLITAVTPQRIGDDVYLSFTVPDTNADGQKPADIGELDVYAVTSAKAPATENQREVATLIATLPVRPILPVPPAPADGPPPPADPVAAGRRSRRGGRRQGNADAGSARRGGTAG